ncbi:proton-conducting transporter transmembrane domain-containing protein [Candidatus Neoehrlichia procyonis]|uniref:NADH-Ubiquinone/plastoquinone (Complex I), various chains family protein n=1 Tax=Candidatus Neoehrlichia procyonis str. RAC413 TaxID=1359163 RepID=A0A0F3NMH6_9RICK|nr:proton-conducting transporter membrane subunit [Candidatus Neoehrlichia lotoris]KJV69245.1 NADH-Ubiquinone/plastoquinone (complex I), various chains family protein [Candidatus Neoehrlichia lotoris str. RAC413]
MIDLISNNLPVFQVILPLIMAVLCSILKKNNFVQVIIIGTVFISLFISCMLFWQVYNGSVILYNVGRWPSSYGIELKVDLLSATVLVLVNFIAIMSVFYGINPNKQEIHNSKIPGFYSLFLLSLGGLLGILVANDVFNIYVFLEISSISSYVLVAMGRNKLSLIAAFEYLIIGTIGATFYLIGIGFLYSVTGVLNVHDLCIALQGVHANKAVHIGILFIILGLSIKIALFPFHSWLIKSYSNAPIFIAVFFSGTTTKVMVYLLIRFTYSIFGTYLTFVDLPFGYVLLICAFCAIVIASILAINSNSLQKVFAYSSVANIGYIIFAITINTHAGILAAIIFIINHSLVKSAMFMVIGNIVYSCGFKNVSELTNISKIMPGVAVVFTILSLNLLGIPPTLGFVAKWYIVDAVIKSKMWIGIGILVIGSIGAIIYIWRIIEKLYFNTEVESANSNLSAKIPKVMTLCVWLMMLIIMIMGVYPMFLISLSKKIAYTLLIH